MPDDPDDKIRDLLAWSPPIPPSFQYSKPPFRPLSEQIEADVFSSRPGPLRSVVNEDGFVKVDALGPVNPAHAAVLAMGHAMALQWRQMQRSVERVRHAMIDMICSRFIDNGEDDGDPQRSLTIEPLDPHPTFWPPDTTLDAFIDGRRHRNAADHQARSVSPRTACFLIALASGIWYCVIFGTPLD